MEYHGGNWKQGKLMINVILERMATSFPDPDIRKEQ